MVQRSEAPGAQPTEQSPLLIKPDAANGSHAYVSIDEVSPEGSLRNGVNGSVPKIRTEDEESQGTGEVEEGIGRSKVVRIILVLLIGAFLFFPEMQRCGEC